MNLLRRMMYMGLGAFLVLTLVLGGAFVYAQSGDDADAETQDEEQATDEEGALPAIRAWRFHERGAHLGGDGQELLAEALGITVDELQEAYEDARQAIVDQALEEELITEAQAEALREGDHPFGLRRGLQALDVDFDALLAEVLGISVEELDEARSEARAARLDALVADGVLTQDQADLIAAHEAVQEYVDVDGLAEMIQNAYQEAIAAALEDGAITQDQADQLLENAPTFDNFRFGGPRCHHFRGHGPAGGFSLPGAIDLDTSVGA